LELKRTFLNQAHVDQGGKLVDFSGWSLPIHYGSQIKEHLAVRHGVGIFDVSHMTIIDCKGPMVRDFLRRVLANDVGSLAINQALYSVLLNERGGVVDDLIVYRLSDCYRLVTNAATKDKVLAWLDLQNLEQIQLEELDLSMIAIQGPRSLEAIGSWSKIYDFESLKPFSCVLIDEVLVARTRLYR
jgi:Glycine cleavage system T protein (aminomethyltransferase)